MTKLTVLLGICSALMITVDAEAAYRCEGVNAQGQSEVVFSDLAMPNYECTPLRATPPPAEDPSAAMENLREQVEALDDDSAGDDTVASNNQENDGSRDAQFAENCQISKDNLAALQSSQDVVSTNEAGEKVLLNSEQRQKQLQQAQKDIDYYCN